MEDTIDKKINENSSRSQYSVSPTPIHYHNGIDSPRLPPVVIAGKFLLNEGFNAKVVVDQRITASSILVLTNGDFAIGILAGACFNGYVNATGAGLNSPPNNINYIIYL